MRLRGGLLLLCWVFGGLIAVEGVFLCSLGDGCAVWRLRWGLQSLSGCKVIYISEVGCCVRRSRKALLVGRGCKAVDPRQAG